MKGTYSAVIGSLAIQKKVLARLEASGVLSSFPGLDDVLKEAVNCRNHYVHGSPGKIDYARNPDITIFLRMHLNLFLEFQT